MVLLAVGLIIIGVAPALAGLELFRLRLPLVGFVSGLVVGFSGVQGVFGTGAVSTSVALIMALVTGVIMAVLSFLFFEIAIIILSVIVGAAAFSYLAVAIGLGNSGFILFMLSLFGGIAGFIAATSSALSRSVVIAVTSLLGSAYVLCGVMLLVGSVSLDQLNNGIIRTVLSVVDQEFVWLLAWLAGSIIAINIQRSTPDMLLLSDAYEYDQPKHNRNK